MPPDITRFLATGRPGTWDLTLLQDGVAIDTTPGIGYPCIVKPPETLMVWPVI